MEMQNILKPRGKIVIVCDFREREVIEHLKKLGAVINKRGLMTGDFICSKRLAIERKTHSDFIGSIIDGRLFEQANDLKNNFEKPIVIIEGYSNRKINENALKAAISSLLIDFGISILATKNPLDTAKTIFWMAKREQGGAKKGITIRIGKKPKKTKKLQEFIICSLPGVSVTLAKRLLQYFGSIERIFTADEKELQEVNGVGKKLAENVKKILLAKY